MSVVQIAIELYARILIEMKQQGQTEFALAEVYGLYEVRDRFLGRLMALLS